MSVQVLATLLDTHLPKDSLKPDLFSQVIMHRRTSARTLDLSRNCVSGKGKYSIEFLPRRRHTLQTPLDLRSGIHFVNDKRLYHRKTRLLSERKCEVLNTVLLNSRLEEDTNSHRVSTRYYARLYGMSRACAHPYRAQIRDMALYRIASKCVWSDKDAFLRRKRGFEMLLVVFSIDSQQFMDTLFTSLEMAGRRGGPHNIQTRR